MENSLYPLHQAIWNRDEDKFKLCLKQQENLNLKDEKGLRPLDIAIMTNNHKLVSLLFDNAVEGDIVVDMSTWQYAICLQDEAIIMNLIRYNVDSFMQSQNTQGERPIHYAVLQRSFRLVKLFINLRCDLKTATYNGYTPLHYAVMMNDSNIVDLLLAAETRRASERKKKSNNTDISNLTSAKTVDGRSPLHLAVKHRCIGCLMMLLNAKVDVNDPVSNSGITALHIAVENNDICIVNVLLAHSADKKCQDNDGRSLLHVAAEYGHDSMIKFFLSKELDINNTMNDGSTPLHVAIKHKNESTAALLLEQNADVHLKDGNNLSPLCLAIKHNYTDLAVQIVLKGADVHEMVNENWSILHLAVRHYTFGKTELVKLLLEKNVNIYLKNVLGQNALHIAARYCYSDVINLLLDKGGYVNETTLDQSTALHYAIENGFSFNVISALIRYGADVNAMNNQKETVLHLAVKSLKVREVEELLINGANPSTIAEDGTSPLLRAIDCSENNLIHGQKIEELLIKHGANVNKVNINDDSALHVKFRQGKFTLFDVYLKNGILINSINKNGESLLQVFLESKNYISKKILMTFGPDSMNIVNNKNGESALHLAIKTKYSRFLVVKHLLDNGAKTTAITLEKNTVLHYAAKYLLEEELFKRLIIECKDIVNSTNNDGQTAMHMLIESKEFEFVSFKDQMKICELLLKYGADINIKDHHNNSALSLAVEIENLEMIKLLLKHGASLSGTFREDLTIYDMAECCDNNHIYNLLLLHF